jgi:putative colanic acid biosynthesis glycosyltransferase
VRPIVICAPRFLGSKFVTDFKAVLRTKSLLSNASAPSFPAPIVMVGLPNLACWLYPVLGQRLILVIDGAEDLSEALVKRLRNRRVVCFSFSSYTRLRKAGADASLFVWAPDGPEEENLPRLSILVEAGAKADERLPPSLVSSSRQPTRIKARSRGLWGYLLSFATAKAQLRNIDAALGACAIYVACRKAQGLNDRFLDAMANGAIVVAFARGLASQFITDGVSGLLKGGETSISEPQARSMSRMARRVTRRARVYFERDSERLLQFINGERTSQRTIARIAWAPAPASGFSPSKATEGGKRLFGRGRTDTTDGAPLITVAIVVRNARCSFAPTLASVLAQNYTHLEIIVVDGASTDGTREEIISRADSIDYWISESDQGPYDGMNKAARLARGRFLIFMNAGDFFPHEQAIADVFEDPELLDADVIVGHHVYVDKIGVERLQKGAYFEQTWEKLCAGDISWEWLAGVPCGQAVFIRSAALREQPFDLSYEICADHKFLYEARRRGRRFAHCDSIIGVYTSGGLSGTDDRRTSRELLRLARQYGPEAKVDAWFRRNLPYAFDTLAPTQ